MSNLNAPFPWFGGKRKVADVVWSRFGKVKHYLEPFAGSAAVLLRRPTLPEPYGSETINDFDGYLSNFWRALRADPEGVIRHADFPLNELDLHARNSYLIGKRESITEALRADPTFYDSMLAGWWVWGQSGWIGVGWASRDSRSLIDMGARGTHCHAEGLLVGEETIRQRLIPLAQRLRHVKVTCGDWKRIVGSDSCLYPSRQKNFANITGVFLDPPYFEGKQQYAAGGTGSSIAEEVFSWCTEHQEEPFLKIALCGYEGHYDLEPHGWECFSWETNGGYGRTSGGSVKDSDSAAHANANREVIWFSPSCAKKKGPLFSLF